MFCGTGGSMISDGADKSEPANSDPNMPRERIDDPRSCRSARRRGRQGALAGAATDGDRCRSVGVPNTADDENI
jgi:hypothetical protein